MSTASAVSLVHSVMRQTALVAVAGGVIGAAGAVVINRELSRVLFDVRSLEPGVYIAAVLTMLGAIVVVSIVPTLGCLRVDPRRSMQAE